MEYNYDLKLLDWDGDIIDLMMEVLSEIVDVFSIDESIFMRQEEFFGNLEATLRSHSDELTDAQIAELMSYPVWVYVGIMRLWLAEEKVERKETYTHDELVLVSDGRPGDRQFMAAMVVPSLGVDYRVTEMSGHRALNKLAQKMRFAGLYPD